MLLELPVIYGQTSKPELINANDISRVVQQPDDTVEIIFTNKPGSVHVNMSYEFFKIKVTKLIIE